MKYKIIENHIKNPKLIYDGYVGEGKKVIYKFKSPRGKSYKIDLVENDNDWKELPEKEFELLNYLFKFPSRNEGGEKVVFSHIKDLIKIQDAEDLEIFRRACFARVEDKRSKEVFIIYFSFEEVYPTRFQIYVLAVVQIEY